MNIFHPLWVMGSKEWTSYVMSTVNVNGERVWLSGQQGHIEEANQSNSGLFNNMV